MPFGLYIHVPFCARRCPYCDFAFVVRKHPPTERFCAALKTEIGQAGLQPADTLYFGGGTPSLLDPGQVADLIAAVPRRPNASITLEANPDDLGRFAELSRAGVQRLSIGVQSLHDRHLQTLGRSHTGGSAREALQEAVRVFGDVNADLIFGIPQQTTEELIADAQSLIETGVTHISAYGLTVHEGTLLAKAVRKGEFTPVVENAERDHFLALDAFLRGHSFEHYEISNYAKPGYRSRHNELYWTGASYRGLGPSAHSYDAEKRRRFWNMRSYDKWVAALEAGQSPIEGEETLDEEAQRVERIYLNLRRSDGLAQDALPASSALQAKLAAASKAGLLTQNNGRICLTPEGMAIADSVVESLLLPE